MLSMGSELTAPRMGLTKMQIGVRPILKHGTLVMYRFRSKVYMLFIVCFRLEFFYLQTSKKIEKRE